RQPSLGNDKWFRAAGSGEQVNAERLPASVVFPGSPSGDGVHLRFGLPKGHTGFQAPAQRHPLNVTLRVAAPIPPGKSFPHHHRDPKIRDEVHETGPDESARTNAHHRKRLAVDEQLAAYHTRVAVEPLLPIVVAEHSDRMRSRGKVVFG